MFDFDINKVQYKKHNVITYNSFNEKIEDNRYRSMGNIFRDSFDGERTGVSWLDYNASITDTIQKLAYWFRSINKEGGYGISVKYLLIHPRLKEYIDKNNIDLKHSSFTLLVCVNDTIPCNKVVMVGDDNGKTCAIITVFDEEDIDKLV